MPLLGLVQSLVDSEPELNGLIAVRLVAFDLRDHIRAAFDNGDRMHDARLIEDLRHTQLPPDQSLNHWLSPDHQDARASLIGRRRLQSVMFNVRDAG